MSTDVAVTANEIEYPTSDGKPMAESDTHRAAINTLIDTLDGYFAGRADVCVSGNLLVYYVPGDLKKVLAPDCFVAFGVPKRARPWYKTWEEGRYPSVVFEVTSKSTRKDDLTDKLATYRDVWKVEEYFLFDPLGEYLAPQLQGYRWVDGDFAPMEMVAGQFLYSAGLGLILEAAGGHLLLTEADTNRRLYPPDRARAIEEARRRRQAEHERDAERQARERAERDREQAERQAAAERSAREQAEAELARLKAELDALRQPPIA
jgi:Uma2 family endonuclease